MLRVCLALVLHLYFPGQLPDPLVTPPPFVFSRAIPNIIFGILSTIIFFDTGGNSKQIWMYIGGIGGILMIIGCTKGSKGTRARVGYKSISCSVSPFPFPQ